MDNKLLEEVLNELNAMSKELGAVSWNAQSHNELAEVIDKLEEDIDNLIDHIEYQKFSLALHGDK